MERNRTASQKNASTLFIFDESGAWTRYRCDHQAERLALCGVSADVVQSTRLDFKAAVDRYEQFVLNRVQWSQTIGAFLDRVRRVRRAVIFDTDDLLFEPDLVHHLAAFDGWPERDREAEIEKIASYRQTLEACDGASTSTEPLAEHARKRSPHVEVVYNVVSETMVELAENALASARPPDDSGVPIAYLSGTRTHNRDFLEAADAVLWALEEYPQTRFLAVGKLALDERFDRFGARVTRIGLQPWQTLPEILSGVAINLAPLEPDNPFTECKSCVKYLEAGLLRVPTVASPRPDFVRAIEHGRNGLLADKPAEWQAALGELIESAKRRSEIGTLAREDVRANHTTRAQPSRVPVR